MAVDEDIIKKRITEVLNACAAGTFSTTVDSNYLDRNATAISEAWREASMMIARAIVANPNHPHRNVFISGTPTTLTHQAELPDMSGEMDNIEIQLYNGGAWTTGTPRTVQQIESYRLNPSNLYGVAHTTEGSPLAGYYSIQNGRVYFTGYAARGYFPLIDRTTCSALIPGEYEDTGVKLGIGLSIKEGDNLAPIGQFYYQAGLNDLASITNLGAIQPMPTVAAARAARGDV